MSRYFHYISCLQEGLTYFGLKVSGHSGLRVSGDFGPKNYTRNIQKYFLSFSNFSWIFFYAKLSRNTEILFYGILKLITAWLTQFCVSIHPNLFIFDLAYTCCRNPFLCINWKSCWNLSRVPTFDHFHYFSSTKSGSISFFSSSNMHQSHHNVGYREQVTTILSHIFSILYRSGTKCNAEG